MIKSFFKLVLLLLLAFSGWMAWFATTPLELPQTPYEFTLKHGSSLRSVSRQLASVGVLAEPWSFTALVRLHGKASEVKAGNYLLDKNPTPMQLLRMITSGDVSMSEIAFIEGWTFRRMRQTLDKNEAVRHDSLSLSDQEIMEKIGAEERSPEGLFFPDTYNFSSGMSDLAILKRSYREMKTRLSEAWEDRTPLLPYQSSYEALVMASIVEKETGRASERPQIAGVFINRLRLNMKLQTDPTVIYGMGESYDGNIRKQDLLADTPYNTYTRYGLPPTPIAMPGLAAIQAALHPASTRDLYFVGKGDGSHKFSATLEEHNQAVVRYQLNRK
jgi:UPF0755 protein